MTHRIHGTSFASVYPHYVANAERKGRTKAELDEVIESLTGYGDAELARVLEDGTDMETFFAQAPRPNPDRSPGARRWRRSCAARPSR